MKLSKIVDIYPSLSTFSTECKLPVKVSFRVASNLSILKPLMSNFEETRNRVAKELGELSKDGSRIEFTEENSKKFEEQMKSLLDEECSVQLITIKLSDLENLNIEPIKIVNLVGTVIIDE